MILLTWFVSIQGVIKNKMDRLRRWSTSQGGSFKHPSKIKTLSLRSPTEAEEVEDLCNEENERRRLRPMVASVFGQVRKKMQSYPILSLSKKKKGLYKRYLGAFIPWD